jgi:hypothetical protein
MSKADDQGLVGSSCGLTVMLGGFQSVRVDCWLVLPTSKKRLKQKHRKCADFVYEKVCDEVRQIYERGKQIRGNLEKEEC